jgi:MFS family permease
MKKYFGLTGQSLHHAIAALAGIGFVLFGYDQGVMSGLLTLPTFVETFPEMDTVNKALNANQIAYNSKVQGVVVAIYEIGCMFSALSTLWAGDKFGRRKTVFGGAIIMCIGAAIQCSSFTLAQFTVGRYVAWSIPVTIDSLIPSESLPALVTAS